MTKEDKQLLIKDLCARLPYGVKLDNGLELRSIDVLTKVVSCSGSDRKIDFVKPYLRPMSTMTEEEEREVRILWNEDFVGDNNWYHCYPKTTDFYLSHHLDFRNLIQRGLALEAPEGMYKAE